MVFVYTNKEGERREHMPNEGMVNRSIIWGVALLFLFLWGTIVAHILLYAGRDFSIVSLYWAGAAAIILTILAVVDYEIWGAKAKK